MKVVRRLAVFLVLVLLQPVTGYTGTITTPEIVAQTTTAALVLHAVDAHRCVLLATLHGDRVLQSGPRSRSVITTRIWW